MKSLTGNWKWQTCVYTWLQGELHASSGTISCSNNCPAILSPDLTQHFYYKVLAIWKVIYTRVNLGSGTETRCAVASFPDPCPAFVACSTFMLWEPGMRPSCMHIPCLCIRNSLIAMATWERSRRLCCMTGLRKSRYLSLRRSSSVAWDTRQSIDKH